ALLEASRRRQAAARARRRADRDRGRGRRAHRRGLREEELRRPGGARHARRGRGGAPVSAPAQVVLPGVESVVELMSVTAINKTALGVGEGIVNWAARHGARFAVEKRAT